MKILITGGSGFLGTALTQSLKTHGVKGDTASVTWVSRSVEKEKTKNIADDVISYDDLASTNERYDVIINLAGAGIADSRWTNARKQELFDSRLKPTQAVIDYIERMGNKPKLLISGSAIGWYGIQHENDPTALDETSPVTKTDFAHEICQAWEQLALTAQGVVTDAVPVAIVRTGVVIAPEGGMVGRLITPFKMGTGGKLGNGQQIMSWISRTDWVRAVIFIIEQNLTHTLPTQQIYNLTNPTPISNAAFTDAMGTWLHRPTVMTLPAFVVKTMFGEMSTLLLDGQRVVPTALLNKGFEFNDLTVLDALKS
ncbi:TIGR01777 family protein [Enhydrobacter aerosaccus SK60]|nr:TIGR01777 family protein [Enhydrobacter aerosaccus SK60]